MNIDTVTTFINDNKGQDIAIILIDGTEIYGSALSVNSKGVNVKVDGKTRSVAISRIDSLELDAEDDTYGADDTADDEAAADYDGPGDSGEDDEDGNIEDNMIAQTDEEIYAELGDGMTTAELAAHLSDSLNIDLDAKALRVHLRALGLGVGKGRKYSLTATEYRLVKDLVNA